MSVSTLAKILLPALFFSSAASAQQFDPDAAYYRAMNNMQQEDMARAAWLYQAEAPARSFEAIHAETERNSLEQEIEANRNQLMDMHLSMYGY